MANPITSDLTGGRFSCRLGTLDSTWRSNDMIASRLSRLPEMARCLEKSVLVSIRVENEHVRG